MKIGLFSDTYVPEINGVANSTAILKDVLQRHGHTVYVITTRPGLLEYKWEEDHQILRLPGIELKFLYGYILTSPLHLNAMKEIEQLQLDIIHAQTEFGIGIFARICAKQLHLPLVSTYHTTYEDYTHYINFIGSKVVDDIAKKAVASLSKLYGESSLAVIAPSPKTKAMLEGYGIATRIEVIPTGLSLDRFHPKHQDLPKQNALRKQYGIDQEDLVLLSVGRIAQEKSLDVVIKMFAQLPDHSHLKLLIVGGGPALNDLQKLVSSLGIQQHVIFTGPILAQHIVDYYHLGNIFVTASQSETQGMTFIEALASGLPLLAKHDDVFKPLIEQGKTGWYYETIDDFQQVIQTYRTQQDQYAEACIQQVQPYSDEAFYTKMIHVYQDIYDEYYHQYEIVNKKDKQTMMIFQLHTASQDLELAVSYEDILTYQLSNSKMLSHHMYELLKAKEPALLAYQTCLRKLASHDQTRKQIYDYLTQQTTCDIATINDIVTRLEQQDYLNDERYTKERIDVLQSRQYGEKRIIQELKKVGIPYEMIMEYLQLDDEVQFQNAFDYAKRLVQIDQKVSIKKKKLSIQQKLQTKGFSFDIIEKVMGQLTFEDLEQHQLLYVEQYLQKALKKYAKKYHGQQLRQKLYQSAYQQGYQSQDIQLVLDQMEECHED